MTSEEAAQVKVGTRLAWTDGLGNACVGVL